jgi:DNA modification methylase
MATSGYSGTPLLKKLSIKEEMKVQLINAPNDYFTLLEKDISYQLINKKETPDFVHLFSKSKKEFENEMKKLKPVCRKNTSIIIWVSWYKKSAGIETDITETDIRNYALQNDLVDIKVCAVSEQWSGLKLVVPIAKR